MIPIRYPWFNSIQCFRWRIPKNPKPSTLARNQRLSRTLTSIASFLLTSATFNSLFRVVFNFPSRYLFAIGLSVLFSLRWKFTTYLELHYQATRLDMPDSCCKFLELDKKTPPFFINRSIRVKVKPWVKREFHPLCHNFPETLNRPWPQVFKAQNQRLLQRLTKRAKHERLQFELNQMFTTRSKEDSLARVTPSPQTP